jgi:hypothetical protein
MINWTKETARKNYCGWCDGHPPPSPCNGTCFNKVVNSKAMENRLDHLRNELAAIPTKRGELDVRESELIEELVNMGMPVKEPDELHKKDSLFPDIYAQRFLINLIGYNEHGPKTTSQEAKTFIGALSKVLNMPEEEVSALMATAEMNKTTEDRLLETQYILRDMTGVDLTDHADGLVQHIVAGKPVLRNNEEN